MGLRPVRGTDSGWKQVSIAETNSGAGLAGARLALSAEAKEDEMGEKRKTGILIPILIVAALIVVVIAAVFGTHRSIASENEGYITVEKARVIALADAGVDQNTVTVTKTALDTDAERVHYDVEFYTDEYEYEYEIDVVSGSVMEKEKEPRTLSKSVAKKANELKAQEEKELQEEKGQNQTDSAKNGTEPNITSGGIDQKATGNEAGEKTSSKETEKNNAYIGTEKALQIALKDAGLTKKQVQVKKTELDIENGRAVYEISFTGSDSEYEYEIDAKDGSVIEADRDIMKSENASRTGNDKSAPLKQESSKTGNKSSQTKRTDEDADDGDDAGIDDEDADDADDNRINDDDADSEDGDDDDGGDEDDD